MQKKLFLYFGIVFVIGMLISTLLSFSVIKKETDTTTRDHMITDVKLIAEAIRNSRDIAGGAELNGLPAGIEEATRSRITLIDMDGVVLYDSEVDYKTMGNHGDRPEFLEAKKSGLGISTRYSNTLSTDFLYVAQKTMTVDGKEYVIRLSMPLKGIKDIITKTERELEWAFFIGLLISLLMGYSVAVFLSRPLRKITASAKEITEGNFGGRLYYKGNDEIRNLTSAFNEMTDKLGKTMTELKQKNANMESILDNVINGIIAVDNDEKVLFMNRAAASYIGIEHPGREGQYAIQAIRDNNLDEFIKFLIADKELSVEEMKFVKNEGRDFLVYGNPMFGEESTEPYGYIIVIHDITDIKHLERIRTDFVANVSHELKTPLTSIRGFAETLKNGVDDPEVVESFLGIILEESERLQSLINDILSLSEIESKKVAYDEEFEVHSCFEEVVHMLEPQAADKKQSLTLEKAAEPIYLYGNRNKFKQMLINLIENGIKYTPEAGAVRINTKRIDNLLEFTVADNGIGIPKESLGRIFERFYRVDKARSREMGGTGLGLSIVKHIVQTFDGKIEVDSTLGVGTTIRITCPIKK